MPNETVTAENKELKKLNANAKKLKKEITEMQTAIEERKAVFNRAFQLMDAVTQAVEAGDMTAMEQTAGACREYLDKYRGGLPVIG